MPSAVGLNPPSAASENLERRDPLWDRITSSYHVAEAALLSELVERAAFPPQTAQQVLQWAERWVLKIRSQSAQHSAVESLMREYDLSSEEGVLLMCVAEALLRIPDAETADKLIADKLGDANWQAHLGQSESLFVNASTWGLMLTGKLISLGSETKSNPWSAFKRLIARSGEPVIRLAVRQAMRLMGHQFVMGRHIGEALTRSRSKENRAYRYSYDMLGEAALTHRDAERYFTAYQDAIRAIGATGPFSEITAAPSISVKLSALHPRYEWAQQTRVLRELSPKLLALAKLAKSVGIGMTVDAEESDRLQLSLQVIDAVFQHASLGSWNGFGLALQAYQKRASDVIDWLAARADQCGRRWCVRLVKGAYWDSEIKKAQVEGHSGYPVFTRKPNTDVSYLACAKKLFDFGERFYPQFASHNAHTIAAIGVLAQGRPFEFQRLHGMGSDLYAEVMKEDGGFGAPCRVYAPVGSHEDLLPYLVRRLLENGANTSFVNRIADSATPVAELIADPIQQARRNAAAQHPKIPLPSQLYADRKNSMGTNLANEHELRDLLSAVQAATRAWVATPLVPGYGAAGARQPVYDPADRRRVVGHWVAADEEAVDLALRSAMAAQPQWDRLPAASRARILEHAADLLEKNRAELIALCIREAGKTIPDAIAEVREAVDFCRYYAVQGRSLFGQGISLPGPTGERNELFLNGRGVFAAISPWNFPLAIFMGQVCAALMAGNSVVAKPAEQTNLIGYRAIQLLHEAGVPADVLQFLPGEGGVVGSALTRDPRVCGVVFTGSTETARAINRALAARDAAIPVLIAETGGQNALIADSSALPEQLVKDAIASAFTSAGQRCSAARVLFVQEEIADKVITMLAGAMDELVVGDPGSLSTDVGPVIDGEARRILQAHQAEMDASAKLIRKLELGPDCAHGTFFAPCAYEIASLRALKREVFGPVLHVIRYSARDLDGVIAQINETGYGLTLGIHSRIDSTIAHIQQRVRAGNCYVNRNMIGAVVGVQPFGGEGLSGTGPKAGGPHYLLRFATERTLTVNTTAAGGNASLLTLGA